MIPEPVVQRISGYLGFAVSGLLATLAIPTLAAGLAALRRHHLAPHLLVITAVLNLANLPVGTVVAAYTFHVITGCGLRVEELETT